MIYQFRSSEGERAEFEYSTSHVPGIGETVTRGGKRWTRLVSSGVSLAVNGIDYRVRPKGVLGRGLPKKHSMDPDLQKYVDGWSPSGDARFESDHAARRWTDKANAKLDAEGATSGTYDYSKDQPSGEDICEMQESARRRMYGAE